MFPTYQYFLKSAATPLKVQPMPRKRAALSEGSMYRSVWFACL